MTSGVVSGLHIHPIKSCHRIEVGSAVVATTGLEGDRQWQVSAGMKPVTQRQKALLATVRPEIVEGGLRISAAGRAGIDVATPTEADAVTGSLVGQRVDVGDAGDEAASWFSTLLDEDVRLYGLIPGGSVELPSAIDALGQPIAFGDITPVLVTNTASLDWLAERADESFAMTRFRPNVVVETDEPFAEDTWARFRLGAAELRHGIATPRCAVPQVDQESGERQKEPAKVLRTHRLVESAPEALEALRPIIEGSSVFGVGCSIGPIGATIRVGDALEVVETMTPLLPAPLD